MNRRRFFLSLIAAVPIAKILIDNSRGKNIVHPLKYKGHEIVWDNDRGVNSWWKNGSYPDRMYVSIETYKDILARCRSGEVTNVAFKSVPQIIIPSKHII